MVTLFAGIWYHFLAMQRYYRYIQLACQSVRSSVTLLLLNGNRWDNHFFTFRNLRLYTRRPRKNELIRIIVLILQSCFPKWNIALEFTTFFTTFSRLTWKRGRNRGKVAVVSLTNQNQSFQQYQPLSSVFGVSYPNGLWKVKICIFVMNIDFKCYNDVSDATVCL